MSVTPAHLAHLRIPGYRIERELGHGGMAVVYLATQESLDRPVALKVLSSRLTEDELFSARFLKEAHIIAKLSHPNIVTIFDVGRHERRHYISMEYLPGGTLKARIRAGLDRHQGAGDPASDRGGRGLRPSPWILASRYQAAEYFVS